MVPAVTTSSTARRAAPSACSVRQHPLVVNSVTVQPTIGRFSIGDAGAAQGLPIARQVLTLLGLLRRRLHQPIAFGFVHDMLEHPPNGGVVRHPGWWQRQQVHQHCSVVLRPIGNRDRCIVPTPVRQHDDHQHGYQVVHLPRAFRRSRIVSKEAN